MNAIIMDGQLNFFDGVPYQQKKKVKNIEKYRNTQDRIEAMRVFCNSKRGECGQLDCIECIMMWLEQEDEYENNEKDHRPT